jgi:hypothetical protein
VRLFALFHTALFWGCFLLSTLLVVAGLSFDLYAPFGALIGAAGVLIGSVAPGIGIALALFALPLGGNRPGTAQSFLATLAGASLFIGIAARGLRSDRSSLCRMSADEVRNPVLFLGLLYCFFSTASLSSIPITHIIDDLRNASSRESIQALAFSIYSLMFTSEHTLVYSFVSVYSTSLAFLLGFAVYRICTSDTQRYPKILLSAAFLGLLSSLVIGVLDYYGFIDLLWLRGLDPIVNPGGTQFRLQSLFGHSGWYAEYLTLAIPTSLVILALNVPFWMRAAAILVALALGEFVLILTYQRGGWLSYPLTLVAVWAAIYVVRLLERNESDIARALRRSIVKICISLPLTVVVSLLLVFAIQGKGSVQEAMSPYVSRFKDIQRTGDRTEFVKAGFLIGSLHPVLGGAADSFAWQFEREVESPRGTFAGRFNLPLHGSAHNVYAQTFSGKGICGLVTLLAIPIAMLLAVPRVLRDSQRSITDKLIVLTGGCYASAFLIYGNVQEVFYVQVLQFLFFAVVGLVAAVGYQNRTLSLTTTRSVSWLCLALISLHLVWEFVSPGPTRAFYAANRQFGCFPQEAPPGSSPYRWCGERAAIERAVDSNLPSLEILVEAGPISQTILIADGEMERVSVSLAPGERKVVNVPLLKASQAQGRSVVRFEASGSFVPRLLWPASDDTRRLAFKVYSVP